MNALESPETTTYAAQVRAALADLPAEEIEELTGGLEADLAESWADSGGVPLIDPVTYAAELRQAAGLPIGQRRPGAWSRTITKWGNRWTAWVSAFRNVPGGAVIVDYVVALRPAWWFLRAWLAYQVLIGYTVVGRPELIPGGPVKLLALLALVAGSVWLGMQKLNGFFKGLVILGNIFAIFMLFAVSSSLRFEVQHVETVYEQGDLTGVYLNGDEVTNLFGYDADGNLINQLQLFDQNGNPVETSVDGGNGCLTWVLEPSRYETDNADCEQPGVWVPTQLETGTKAWNVFPMQIAESDPSDWDLPRPDAIPMDAKPPFVKVPALDKPIETAEDSGKPVKNKSKPSKNPADR